MRVEIWIWNFIYRRSVQNSSSLEFDEFSSRFTENLFIFLTIIFLVVLRLVLLQNAFDVFVLFIFFLTKNKLKTPVFWFFFLKALFEDKLVFSTL